VKISSVGVKPDSPVSFFRWHAGTEQHLKDSGLPFTILQPNFFMQNTFSFAPTIVKEGKFYGAAKNGKIAAVDIRDVASVAARTLTDPGHEGKTYLITGPEAITLSDVAAKLSAALGKPVTYDNVPGEALRQALLGAGLQEWQATGLVELHESLAENAAGTVTDVVEKIAGKKPIPFDQFARDFRAAFESSATAR
jgi:uncharacterized protein YbjT (DUF2867 family)